MQERRIKRTPNEFALKAIQLRGLMDDDDEPTVHLSIPDGWWEWRAANLPAIYELATTSQPEAVWRGFGVDRDRAERTLYAAIQCLYEVSYMAEELQGMFERRFGFEDRFRALHSALMAASGGRFVDWPWIEPTPDLF
jgi:hypothetical protein